MRTHYYARTLVDSEINNNRITTFEITFPRFISEQLLTHAMLRRNAGSLRATPTYKLYEACTVEPLVWGSNRPGMQAGSELTGLRLAIAQNSWRFSRYVSLLCARIMHRAGLHKEECNRILTPYLWQTYVITSNEYGWNNFFNQRCDPHAQPEIQKLAYLMRGEYEHSQPFDQYHHIPYDPLFEEDFSYDNYSFARQKNLSILALRKAISIARIARVSYYNHGSNTVDYNKDLALLSTLESGKHYSPFDHVLTYDNDFVNGIFPHWKSEREIRFPEFIQKRN